MVKTWMAELFVVWLVLIGVVWLTRGGPIEAVGALAVLAAFAHAQVAERMREREAAKAKPDVHCHRWLTRYFLVKELLWCSYFVAHRSWAALAGVGVFLAYPIWRAWWRGRCAVVYCNCGRRLDRWLAGEKCDDCRLRDGVQQRAMQAPGSTASAEIAVLESLRDVLPLGMRAEVLPTVQDADLERGTVQARLFVGARR